MWADITVSLKSAGKGAYLECPSSLKLRFGPVRHWRLCANSRCNGRSLALGRYPSADFVEEIHDQHYMILRFAWL